MNFLRIIILFLMVAFAVQPVQAQVTVVLSTKKVVIDGKSFYLHTVKPGETLYSISKAYNILQRDIVFNNPETLEGTIKVGQELKIPVKSEDTTTTRQLQSALYIYHIAEQGQTVYWLTQNYNITQEELYKHNPDLEHSALQAGQVVTIPKKSEIVAQPLKPNIANVVHVVKRGETLFSIAKSYKADLNEVLEMNPEIDANKPNVRVGQEIKIPLPNAAPITLPVATSQTDTVIIRKDLQTLDAVIDHNDIDISSQQESDVFVGAPSDCEETSQRDFRVAMFLPLFLAENSPASAPDTSLVKDNEGRFKYRNGRYWIFPRSENALEFYQGALLALDSLNNQGFNVKINLFDTMRDTVKMAQLLKNPIMKNMDLLIGPFSTELINQVTPFALENKIFCVSPTAINTTSLKKNPYLIQVNAGEINAVNTVVDHIAKQNKIHITLIGNKRDFDQSLYNAYLDKIKEVFDKNNYTTLRMHPDSLQDPGKFLKKEALNIVIVPSADEVFVTIITAKLNTSTHNYNVNLYGLASWTKIAGLDLEYLHTLEFHYATAFYIDYSSLQVQNFLQQYRKNYFTEPTMLNRNGGISPNPYQLAFLGYDITYFFVSALRQYGKDFSSCLPWFQMPLLHTDFLFRKTDVNSGFLNVHFGIYKYCKDYSIVKEN